MIPWPMAQRRIISPLPAGRTIIAPHQEKSLYSRWITEQHREWAQHGTATSGKATAANFKKIILHFNMLEVQERFASNCGATSRIAVEQHAIRGNVSCRRQESGATVNNGLEAIICQQARNIGNGRWGESAAHPSLRGQTAVPLKSFLYRGNGSTAEAEISATMGRVRREDGPGRGGTA